MPATTTQPIKILLQTTIPHTPDDWNIERFSLLRAELAGLAGPDGSPLAAEKLDHHPEWFNVYSRVEVLLATHDAEGVTELDVTLAKLMDAAARG